MKPLLAVFDQLTMNAGSAFAKLRAALWFNVPSDRFDAALKRGHLNQVAPDSPHLEPL